MKKTIIYLVLAIAISSCIRVGDPPQQPPACDNAQNPLSVTLNWLGTTYLCTNPPFGQSVPPQGNFGHNYLNQASANGTIGSLSDEFSFLCQLVCKNDQPASVNCSNPGMGTFTWSTPGPALTIYGFAHANTDVTVDYYDICYSCSPTIFKARPYFTGVVTLPPGATSTSIPMYTQTPYQSPNCQ